MTLWNVPSCTPKATATSAGGAGPALTVSPTMRIVGNEEVRGTQTWVVQAPRSVEAVRQVAALASLTPYGATAALLGGRADDEPDRYALASPLERLPLRVPQLVVHGDADTGVPPAQSRTYVTAALERGDQVEHVEVPGAGHFDVIDPDHPSWQAVVRRLPNLLRTAGD
jgi:pimeloyl-ACP methyl ester carboxylesterase